MSSKKKKIRKLEYKFVIKILPNLTSLLLLDQTKTPEGLIKLHLSLKKAQVIKRA